MNSINNLKWRYAVKKFDHHKTLSEYQVNILKQAFNLTATSYGLQPIKLVVLKNKDRLGHFFFVIVYTANHKILLQFYYFFKFFF